MNSHAARAHAAMRRRRLLHAAVVAICTGALLSALVQLHYHEKLVHDLNPGRLGPTTVGRGIGRDAPASMQANTALSSSLNTILRKGYAAPCETRKISAALCYKTLYGQADLHLTLRWALYNHLLGFDRIFIWYASEMKERSGFDDIKALPYVTLIENIHGRTQAVPSKGPDYQRFVRFNSTNPDDWSTLDQYLLELECLNKQASRYDYVMFADIDEWLWFNESIGLKEFIYRHRDLHTFSFSKWPYSLAHKVNSTDITTDFGVEQFSFTAGPHCLPLTSKGAGKRTFAAGSDHCPGVQGASKLLVHPQRYARNGIYVHGFPRFSYQAGGHHFPTYEAHLKEFPRLFHPIDARLMPPHDFIVHTQFELGNIRDWNKAHKLNANGSLTLRYDDQMAAWFRFVASRGKC